MTSDAQRPSIGDVARSGATSGFDYLRLVLAISVLGWHSIPLVFGREAASGALDTPLGYYVRLVLPAFFALSGFLVSSSLLRSRSLVEFVGLRFLRLIPALAVEICLSALVFGPILTEYDLSEYFSSQQFYNYFLNIIGIIHFELPGLFTHNTYPNVVNGSLWTIPYELECYLVLVGVWVLRVKQNRRAILFALIAWCLLVATRNYFAGRLVYSGDGLQGRMLVAFFLAGVFIYIARDDIPSSFRLFLLSLVLSVAFITSQYLVYLAPLPVAYATVYIGLMRPPKLPFVFNGDYSYGIYLYAFPIQQAVRLVFPTVTSWLPHVLISLLGTSVLAVFSWHLIEKPVLSQKRRLRSAADAAPLPDRGVPPIALPRTPGA